MEVRSTVDHALLLFTPDGVYEVRPRETFTLPDGTVLPPGIAAIPEPKPAKPAPKKDGED